MIELKGVSYKYKLSSEKEILALDNVDLRISEGEYVAIIGHNGSGKTTLARLLNGLLLPTSGEILIDNQNSKDKEAQRQILLKVGMVFQNPDNQIISTTVEREIAFGLENLALPYEEMKPRVEKALEDFNLKKYRLHPPHKLSGGEKQRVALASVLAMQPKYLVLDEPTSLLDWKGKREFLDLIEKLSQKNITLIHITQFPEEAALAKRLLVLSRGKIVLDDFPSNIFQKTEELEKIGLDVPFGYRMSYLLNQKGLVNKGKIYSIDKIAEVVAQRIPNVRAREEKKEVQVENVIEVENLSFSYAQAVSNHKKALDSINLQIKAGDLIGLIGPTGSGKSTLIQHLNGLLKPSEGKVYFKNKDINSKDVDLKKIRQEIALAFQFPELQLFEETVFEDIAFGPKNMELDKSKIEERVKNSMQALGLDFESFAYRSPFSLSGGEQRKVALAGILALEPEVLILDEPTVGLDPQSTGSFKWIIKKLNQSGITVILISHNLDLIAQIAEKIILLDEGKLVSYCPNGEFFENSDRLKEFDLEIPLSIELISKLKERGVRVSEDYFDLEKLVENLKVGDG